MTGRVALVCLASVLLQACSSGGTLSSPRADPAGKRPEPSAPRDASATPTSGQAISEPGLVDSTLGSSDLALVYQFILENYVDRVDHTALIQAATDAVREASLRSGALPLDTAALDLAPLPAGNPERDWLSFARGYDALVHKHPRWAAEARPDWAAIRQMLASLQDSHSQFIEPDEMKRLSETSFSGIGVRMSRPDQTVQPIVYEVFQNSPAARAGLKPGDRIIAVDGKSTESSNISDVVRAIRGPQGTAVTLSVRRSGQDPKDFAVTRSQVDPPRVEWGVGGGVIGVLRIRGFADGVPEMVQQALVAGVRQGARGWILDLRGNSGGSIDAVAKVALNFVGPRPVGVAVDRDGDRTPIVGDGRPTIPRMPLVVLVDRETSSGAEILASAVKEYQVGPVVGTPTAGNVGIARPRQLSDGSAVQITIRRLVSASGSPLDRVGVQPDVQVDLSIADLEKGDDPQLLKAIELMVSRLQQNR